MIQNRPNPAADWEICLPVEGPFSPKFLSNPAWSIARSSRPVRYAAAQAVFLADGMLSYFAGTAISEGNDMLMYLGASILAALYLGAGPALLSCSASLILLSSDRVHSSVIIDHGAIQYLLSISLFLFCTYQVGALAERFRMDTWRNRQRGETLALIGEFTQNCSDSSLPSQVVETLKATIRDRLGLACEQASDSGALKSEPYVLKLAAGQSNVEILKVLIPQGNARLRQYLQALCLDLSLQAEWSVNRIELFEQEERNRTLETTQRLQSALVNSLSHDLQTPLSSILGVFDSLLSPDGILSGEQSQQLISLGQEQSERLLRQVRNLLSISKVDGGALKISLQNLRPHDCVKSALKAFPRQDQSRIQIQDDSQGADIWADPSLLSVLLANLLDNALKFSPSESPVEIHIHQGDHCCCIEVMDSGCGILLQDQDKIFERFYRGQTPKKVPGSGLGLHICKVMSELQHATLTYSPRTPTGSCFTLKLPLVSNQNLTKDSQI